MKHIPNMRISHKVEHNFLIKRKNQSFLIDIYLKVRIVRTDSSMVPVKKEYNNFHSNNLIVINKLLTNTSITQITNF